MQQISIREQAQHGHSGRTFKMDKGHANCYYRNHEHFSDAQFRQVCVFFSVYFERVRTVLIAFLWILLWS